MRTKLLRLCLLALSIMCLMPVSAQGTPSAAQVAAATYRVKVSGTHGKVSGGGTYNANAVVTLRATPDNGYRFVRWSDGDTRNPRSFRIQSDITLEAEFELVVFGLPYSEAFNDTTAFATYWTRYASAEAETIYNGTSLKESVNGFKFSNGDNAYSNGHIHANIYGAGSFNYWVAGPNIDLTGLTDQNVLLQCDLRWMSHDSRKPTDLTNPTTQIHVAVSTDNGDHWAKLESWDNAGECDHYISDLLDGTARRLVLNDYKGEVIRLAFHGEQMRNTGDNDLHIDNVSVTLTSEPMPRYTAHVSANDTLRGMVVGGGTSWGERNMKLSATARHGYYFSRWSDGNTANPRILHLTHDTTLVAEFRPKTYPVAFLNYNGDTLQSRVLDYGTTPTYDGETPAKAATAQYTYTFSGWDKEIVSVIGTETYTATFDSVVNAYPVAFLNYNGDTLQSRVLDYGTTPTYDGETPAKDATAQYTYTFSGWDKEIVSVIGAETYTATFDSVVNAYGVAFLNYNGDTLQSRVLDYGTTPTYDGETPAKDATTQYTYTFSGWDKEIVSVIGTETYTATFDSVVNAYGVAFLNYNGDTLQSRVLDYGTTPTYDGETPAKDATTQYTYTFSGWDKEIVSVIGAETYTATFDSVVNAYGVAFLNYNGDTLQSRVLDYGTTPTYDGETPAKDATAQYTYTFSGWDKEIVSVIGAETYTATFDSVVNAYGVAFLNYNGDTLQSRVLDYGTTPTYDGETPAKDATTQYTYTFSGWDKEIVSVIGAETYTATFDSVVNTYTVTLSVNDTLMGTVLGAGEYAYGTEITVIAVANEGYGFVTWEGLLPAEYDRTDSTTQYEQTDSATQYEQTDSVMTDTLTFILVEDVELRAVFRDLSEGLFGPKTSDAAMRFFHRGTIYIRRDGHLFTLQGAKINN